MPRNPRFTPPFTSQQQKFLAICPKITGVPSIVGSIYMIQHILRSPQRRGRVYTRLLVGMSCMDCLYAIKCFLSTWPIPQSPFVFGSAGTTQSCTITAVAGQGSSLSSSLYNGSLTLYYLLTIRYGWTQSQFRPKFTIHNSGKQQQQQQQSSANNTIRCTNKIPWEILLHLIPLSIGWGTAIVTIPLELMNPIGWTCWIGPWPLGCGAETEKSPPCVRGENAKLYRWIFFHAILWFTVGFVIVSMILIWRKIKLDESISIRYSSRHNNHRACLTSTTTNLNKPIDRQSSVPGITGSSAMKLSTRRDFFGRSDNTRQEDSNEEKQSDPFVRNGQSQNQSTSNISNSGSRIRSSRNSNNKMLLSKRFAQQAFYYVAAFFLAWIFPMVQFAVTNAPDGTLYYPLLALTVIINPLNGAFNALTYLRPRYLRYRQKQLKEQQQQQQQQERQLQQQQRGGGGARAAAVISGRSSGEGSSNDFALGLSFRGPIQAIVSAISVQGDDDEDDWEATTGSNGTPTATATTGTEDYHHDYDHHHKNPTGNEACDGGSGSHNNHDSNHGREQQKQLHSTDEFEFDDDDDDNDDGCIVAVVMQEEEEEEEEKDDDDKLIEKVQEDILRLQKECNLQKH